MHFTSHGQLENIKCERKQEETERAGERASGRGERKRSGAKVFAILFEVPIQQGKLNFSAAPDSVLRKCLNPFREFSWADTRWLEGSVYVTWSQCSPQLCTSRCTAALNGIPQRFVSDARQHRCKPEREERWRGSKGGGRRRKEAVVVVAEEEEEARGAE